MLVELRVENLGIIEEILIPLGTGMTAITGETGAGKTLLVDAVELLCGGRADPAAVREGAEEARVEGRFVLAARRRTRWCSRRVVPCVGRSRGLHRRPARDGRASSRRSGRRLVDLHGQHAHQSLLAPADSARCSTERVGSRAAPRMPSSQTARGRCAGDSTKSWPRWAATNAPVRARSTCCATSSPRSTRPRSPGPTRTRRSPRRRRLLADAEAHREALATVYEALEGAAEDAVGRAAGELAGRAPFAAIADGCSRCRRRPRKPRVRSA